jgi:DNA-binding GntR family transcriptional regulator
MAMERRNMSSSLVDELRDRIVRGELGDGMRINEVHVAGAMQVSRTPLREALTRLAAESFIEARPKLGFFKRPLTAEEARDLYPIRALLDPHALELAGLPPPPAIAKLVALNGELARTRGDVGRVIELDDAWHLALIEHCPNRALLDLIRQMMWRTRRYEYAYLSDPAHRSTAAAEHAQLIAMVKRRDLAGACRWLRTNMSTALTALLPWLEHRRAPTPSNPAVP